MTAFTKRLVMLAVLLGFSASFPVLAAGDKDDPVVATVNGLEIFHSQVEEAQTRLPQQIRSVPLDVVFSLILNSLIDTKLVAAEGRRQGLLENEQIKIQLARIEDQVLERFLLTRAIAEWTTEEVLKERYEAMVEGDQATEEINARHILLETEAEAEEVITQLNDGADFAELAEKKSTGPSASRGGNLGYFAKEAMVAEFSNAAFALEIGAVTEKPVKTQFGWHVIKVEDRRMKTPPTYEELEPELRAKLSRELGLAFLDGLRKGADITRFNLDGTPEGEKDGDEKPQTE